jgi:hypothetical protein
MLWDSIDFLRVWLSMLVLFLAAPLCLAQGPHSGDPLLRAGLGFVRACLFAEVVGLLLGYFGLCLPGSMTSAYLLSAVLSMWWSGRLYRLSSWWRASSSQLLRSCEDPVTGREDLTACAANLLESRWRLLSEARPAAWIPIVTASAASLIVFTVALSHTRFLTAQTYTRALSLQKLILGGDSPPDGSVAFLAPVAMLAGLSGATVIRFSNPILCVILGIAAFLACRRLTGSRAAAWIASGLTPLVAVVQQGELQAAGVSSILWLLAIAVWPISRRDAVLAGAGALLIQFIPDFGTLAIVGVPYGLTVLERCSRWAPATVRRAAACIAGLLMLGMMQVTAHRLPADGPFQYEAAARAADRIRREFRTNTWLIISPGQEVALIYGRGWHLELSNFVNSHTIEQVSLPGFRFQYPVVDTFIFVEKEPLVTDQLSLGLQYLRQPFDPVVASYHLRLNRASLHFRAARLISAYRQTHSVETFYEDPRFAVFRIRTQSE